MHLGKTQEAIGAAGEAPQRDCPGKEELSTQARKGQRQVCVQSLLLTLS